MSAQFLLLTAFASTPTSGNPAAVVFTDLTQPEDVFEDIAQNLNQPITAFLSAFPLPTSDKLKTVSFSVRWYSANKEETPMCGHGAMASAKAVFERADVAEEIEVVELHTRSRGIVIAKKRQGGLIQIEIPDTRTQEVSPEEFLRISEVLKRTSGRELSINHIASGGKGFEHYIIYVLDEKEDLKNLPVNATVLRETGFHTNIYTTQSSNTEHLFVSRMFAPGVIPGDEDPVCGSAHCLLAPYWYERLKIASSTETKAKQVSARGGDLKITWNAEKNTLALAGEVIVLGSGQLKLA